MSLLPTPSVIWQTDSPATPEQVDLARKVLTHLEDYDARTVIAKNVRVQTNGIPGIWWRRT